MSNENIRISTSIPSLKDKIHIDVNGPAEKAYWYIRFNIPLAKQSVNKETMNVTDTDGYIMRTYIDYDEVENLIVIIPLDSYEQNRFYLLNISKKVRSAKGQHLKHEIHILFKLIDNRISQFEILKRTVKVPKPKPRPANYDQMNTKSKVYTFSKESASNVPLEVLPFADMKINVILGVIGLICILASLQIKNQLFTIASVTICAVGVGHIIKQIANKELRSVITYNRGVMHFNGERYRKASILFRQAVSLDEKNELAEYALNKVSFYL